MVLYSVESVYFESNKDIISIIFVYKIKIISILDDVSVQVFFY